MSSERLITPQAREAAARRAQWAGNAQQFASLVLAGIGGAFGVATGLEAIRKGVPVSSDGLAATGSSMVGSGAFSILASKNHARAAYLRNPDVTLEDIHLFDTEITNAEGRNVVQVGLHRRWTKPFVAERS